MKKLITILAMLLIAATAYNQTSRRPANSNNTANKNSREKTSVTHKSTKSNNQRQSRDAIVKTKTTSNRTYHYEQRSPAKKTTTQQARTNVNTERNSRNKSGVVATSQKAKTTPSRETARVTDNQVNRKRTVSSQATNKPRETHHVTKSQSTVSRYKEYNSPRTYHGQHTVVHHYYHKPAPKSYRAKHYVYRRPVDYYIVWTPVMHRHYIRMYPMVKYWHYTNGYHITLVSAYDAEYYRGEVRTVYGRVSEVYYSPTTDEYFLYFGLYYPYQDFTVVIPGYIARRYNHRPERYFDHRHVAVTGLITTFNGEPEIVVKESFQVHLY